MAKTILLADDSVTIQKVVELTFSEGDYRVLSVGNGALALQKIQELRPDIALLDVIMPEANGYEVCEKLKRNPETSWIPVLLLTGTFEPFDRKRADAAGADGHLTKPFESQALISKVEELIASSRHPVVERERARGMEIITGGDTYQVEGDRGPVPQSPPAAPPFEPVEQELTRESIVPDRFDDFDPMVSPPTLPTREEANPPFPPEREMTIGEEGGSVGMVDLRSEPWDELANGLASSPLVKESEARPEVFSNAAVSAVPRSPSPVPEAAEARDFSAPSESPARPPAVPDRPTSSPTVEFSDLKPEDLERIASSVVERLSDRVIREIAWEVIPELAESLIRKRIRELEEKISREG